MSEKTEKEPLQQMVGRQTTLRKNSYKKSIILPSEQRNNYKKSTFAEECMNTSTFNQSMSEYQTFLREFEFKIQNVYKKQSYRIYLNDKTNQRQYQQLMHQQDQLLKLLQNSKDYTQSANRGLIEQIMSLGKIKEQYQLQNKECEAKIENQKKQVTKKAKQLKYLQKEIKSYWIYNYDIVNASINSSRVMCDSRNTDGSNKNSSIYNKTKINRKEQSEIDQTTRDLTVIVEKQKQLLSKQSTVKRDASNVMVKHLVGNEPVHLPYIQSKNKHLFLMKSSSAMVLNSINSTLSKDLSLLNCSATKDRMMGKLESSNRQKFIQKLEYEKEKQNLLNLFTAYLKKRTDDEQSHSERVKNQKIIRELNDYIHSKAQKIKQIEYLLNY